MYTIYVDPCTNMFANVNFHSYIHVYKLTDLITCIDINVFLWQKQLNYSIVFLFYCYVKSSEFVGLWSKKHNIINFKGLWHAFEHV